MTSFNNVHKEATLVRGSSAPSDWTETPCLVILNQFLSVIYSWKISDYIDHSIIRMLHLVVSSCLLAGILAAPLWTFRPGILQTWPSHYKCLCLNWCFTGGYPVLFRIPVFCSMFQSVIPKSFSFGRLLVFGCPTEYSSGLLLTTLYAPLHVSAHLTQK